jgi:hypothetical protein
MMPWFRGVPVLVIVSAAQSRAFVGASKQGIRRATMTDALAVTRRAFLKRGSGSLALSLVIGTGVSGVLPIVEAAPKAVPLKVLNQQEARTLLAMARTLFWSTARSDLAIKKSTPATCRSTRNRMTDARPACNWASA